MELLKLPPVSRAIWWLALGVCCMQPRAIAKNGASSGVAHQLSTWPVDTIDQVNALAAMGERLPYVEPADRAKILAFVVGQRHSHVAEIRRQVYRVLSKFSQYGPVNSEVVLDGLSDQQDDIVSFAAELAEKSGMLDDRIALQLITVAGDQQRSIVARKPALTALSHVSAPTPDIRRSVLELLQSPSDELKCEAAITLIVWDVSTDQVYSAIHEAVRCDNYLTRLRALDGYAILCRRGDRRAVGIVRQVADTDRSAAVRERAREIASAPEDHTAG